MTFSFIDVKVPGETSQNNESQMLVEYPMVTKKANFYDRSDHLKLARHHEKQRDIHQEKHEDHESKTGNDSSHHEYHALLHDDAMQ